MGLLKVIQTAKDSTIGIWFLEESIQELEVSLSFDVLDKVEYLTLKTLKRKREWLGIRVLIEQLFKGEAVSISYDKHRKPILSNGSNISISHSGGYLAVIINKKRPVGIDIQIDKKNIDKAKSLFLRPSEVNELGKQDTFKKLHLYWCAKETLYKYVGDSSLNIYSDFTINQFNFDDSKLISGKINSNNNVVEMEYQINEHFYLVHTL